MKRDLFLCTFAEDALNIIKEFGIGMESNHFCISERLDDHVVEETISEVNKDMRFCDIDDLRKVFVHGPFTEIYPQAIDHLMTETGRKRLDSAFEACRRLGLNRMVVHSGFLPIMYFDTWHVERSVEFWGEYMRDKPSDFSIFIENVFDPNPEPLIEIVETLADPRIKLCLDVGHANAVTIDKSVYQWIKSMGENIGHFHLHNNDGSNDLHNPINDGTLDMDKVLRHIDDYCPPDATLTVESRRVNGGIEWLLERL